MVYEAVLEEIVGVFSGCFCERLVSRDSCLHVFHRAQNVPFFGCLFGVMECVKHGGNVHKTHEKHVIFDAMVDMQRYWIALIGTRFR
jgi:hypothetical protein